MRGPGLWVVLGLCLASCARCANTPAEVVVVDEQEGSGTTIGPSMIATLRYTLARADGGVIESNAKAGQGFNLRVGKGFSMPGFERYVPGMKLKGARRVTAPASVIFGPNLPEGVRPEDAITLSLRVDDVEFLVEP